MSTNNRDWRLEFFSVSGVTSVSPLLEACLSASGSVFNQRFAIRKKKTSYKHCLLFTPLWTPLFLRNSLKMPPHFPPYWWLDTTVLVWIRKGDEKGELCCINGKYDCAKQIPAYNYGLWIKKYLNSHGCVNILRWYLLCPEVIGAKADLTPWDRVCKYTMERTLSSGITNF